MAKMRSPNYPAIGLPEAIALAKLLWAKEQRSSVPADVAVTHFGYSGMNGPARTKLSAMRKYGLLEDAKNGIQLTERALQILHGPADSRERLFAIEAAALMPDLFSDITEDLGNGASDGNISSYLKIKRQFSEAGAKIALKAYRDTIAFLDDSRGPGYTAPQSEAPGGDLVALSTPVASDPAQRPAQVGTTSGGKAVLWLKTEPIDDMVGEVRLIGEPGTPVMPGHLEWLIETLQLTLKRFKAKLDAESNGPP